MLAAALVILEQLIVALLPKSVFYRDRRPTRAGRVANRFTMLWSRYGGPPSYMVELETRSPRSGRWNRVPIVIGAYNGKEYAVSMLGDRSVWVRNLRANGGVATLRHGRRRAAQFVEVTDPKERAPIIKAYVGRAYGARPHIPVDPDAPVADFERIAAAYPVFEITAAASQASVAAVSESAAR
jgi:hypothetical protein